MAIKHPNQSPPPDGPDPDQIQGTDWIADHDVDFGVPSAIGGANAEGASLLLPRLDHVHAHGDRSGDGGTSHASGQISGFGAAAVAAAEAEDPFDHAGDVTIGGDLDAAGHAAFGANGTPVSYMIANFLETFTSAGLGANSLAGIFLAPTLSMSANRAITDGAFSGKMLIQPGGNRHSGAYVAGLAFPIEIEGSGTVDQAYATWAQVQYDIDSFATISGAEHAAYFAAASKLTLGGGGSLSVDSLAGFRAQNQGLAGITDATAFFAEPQSGAANNYLARWERALGNDSFRMDAGDPPDAGLADEGDSNLWLAWMENGTVNLRRVRSRQQGSLNATDRVLVAE